MQQLLPVAIRSVLEKPARYMKVLKGYVQNRTRPEGCIAERYIAEEAVEFCTQHLSDVSTVGVPSSQKMGVSKPLSGCTVSVVDQDLLNQAHLYVLENTEEVLPYIEQHMIHIKTAYPKFRKRTKWLQDKHNSTFIQWLRFKVQSELEEDNHGVSENLRWLAAGPNMAVPLYKSYLIKGIKFNIKAQDDVRTTQNSGVYLLAHTMQVASAKDKNPILSNMGFYGVIQEIWDLDYQKFTIPVFREYNDVIGDEVLGDVIIECEPFTRGMPNVDTFDELVVYDINFVIYCNVISSLSLYRSSCGGHPYSKAEHGPWIRPKSSIREGYTVQQPSSPQFTASIETDLLSSAHHHRLRSSLVNVLAIIPLGPGALTLDSILSLTHRCCSCEIAQSCLMSSLDGGGFGFGYCLQRVFGFLIHSHDLGMTAKVPRISTWM
ncbi:hypothetical protein L3X38_026627 [Prunus dulcis]|uniref:DUF4218 domain-containing protein n=1 Tax=Prunus dulcis TaxID=3755 RepID=A0AAD4YZI0_PRUDU|nr:hypothetical protein L3X38_026627 [Prunus dulcis]